VNVSFFLNVKENINEDVGRDTTGATGGASSVGDFFTLVA
jgi:hypothetical protein